MDITSFDTSLVRKAGLSEAQARCYLTLLQHGTLTPAKLALLANETRSNTYMVCDKLLAFGLITKSDTPKTTYAPCHPSALETLAERRRKHMLRNEQEIKNNLNPLIDLFFAATELPGARTLQGIDGIKEVYTDTLRTKQDIYLVRTCADIPNLGEDYLDTYRQKRANAGIHTHALTPVSQEGKEHTKQLDDERLLFHRTFIPTDAYTAPVEIDIYGDKVAFISFGNTQMATIINSQPIAEAMRQLCQMIIQAHQQRSSDMISDLTA